MKLSKKKVFVVLMMLSVLPIFAETDLVKPKEEFRSAWISTVWGIDWPSSRGTGAAMMRLQQNDMIKMLDSLAANNFNAVSFQVRGMSDAMYKSSYEPWSAYISGTRGKDPGWDPLAFVVEECHKRGMECHAWVNPYRFSTDGSTGAGDVTGYYEKGWLIKNPSGYRILNPSREDVQDRIVNICREIIAGYDVDGMLFDDYYYVSAAMSEDSKEYAAYKSSGGTQSQADWRRGNVHLLMKKLYTMIQETKPWVRFGQAPPGGTFRDASLANKYGIDPCPSGYENCYNSQYIDVMGWLKEGIIDYISPQVYWAIGYSSADYGKMVPWWGTVVNKFERHLFVSQDISSVTSSDRTSTASSGALEITPKMAAGGSMTTFGEVEDQVKLNRTSSLNGAFGSIFFSAKHLYSKTASKPITLAHNLKRHYYSLHALPPAMQWKTTTNPGTVTGLNYDGEGVLSWNNMADDKNKRYTVYAVPNGYELSNFNKDLKYMLGFTYSNTYTVPEDCRYGYYYAVCVYDRYGNEWDAAVWKNTYEETLPSPVIVSPVNDFKTDATFEFTWKAVSGAEMYLVEVAADSEFTDIRKCTPTATTSLSSNEIYSFLDVNTTSYWRVRAIANGKNDGVSEIRSFVYKMPEILYPSNDATDLDPKVNFQWSVITEGTPVTLEVASDDRFANIVLSGESTTGNYQTPICVLKPLTIYFARLKNNGIYSSVVKFSTKAMPAEKPTFKFPLNGGTCWANSEISINPQDGAESVTILIDSSTNFGGTTRCRKILEDFTFGVAASDVQFGTKKTKMVDGTTYYAKAQIKYFDESGTTKTTDWSDVISFVYSSSQSAIDNITTGADVKIAGKNVVINADSESSVRVSAVSMLGREEVLFVGKTSSEQVSLEGLSRGLYIIKVVLDNEVRTLKYMK